MATFKEVEILLAAARWKKRYLDSNPDVGMGPFNSSILDEVVEEVDLALQNRATDSLYLSPSQREWLVEQLDEIDKKRYH